MNSRLPLLHSMTDNISRVGGRSQRYFEFTTRVSSPSTLRRAHFGSRSSDIGACRAPFVVSTTVGTRCGMLFESITGRYIHSATYLVVFLCCDCWLFSSYLAPRLTFLYLCWLFSLYTAYCQQESTIRILYEKDCLQYTQRNQYRSVFSLQLIRRAGLCNVKKHTGLARLAGPKHF
jgi:hypothetical protein